MDRGRGTGGRGRGRGGGHKPSGGGPSSEKPAKKEAILDLSKYVDQRIRVKFTGGREVIGVLKGFDQLMNLVLDDVTEVLPDSQMRKIGLAVLRGPQVTILSPVEGFEEIANPFAAPEE